MTVFSLPLLLYYYIPALPFVMYIRVAFAFSPYCSTISFSLIDIFGVSLSHTISLSRSPLCCVCFCMEVMCRVFQFTIWWWQSFRLRKSDFLIWARPTDRRQRGGKSNIELHNFQYKNKKKKTDSKRFKVLLVKFLATTLAAIAFVFDHELYTYIFRGETILLRSAGENPNPFI